MSSALTMREKFQADAFNRVREVADRRNQLEDKLREISNQLTCLKDDIKYYAYTNIDDALVIRKGAGHIEARIADAIKNIKEVL